MSPARRPALDAVEKKKRRRELIAIASLGSLFLILTWVLFHMFGIAEELPFEHSIFFFGLVNFNIILFLLLAFLIFRNVVKEFAEREGGPIGSSLKSKLIAAFVGFSFVPTALMFLVSVFYINNSFDRWFSQKISGILKSSIEVTDSYYLGAKRKNYHFATEIADLLKHERPRQSVLDHVRSEFSLDSVEYYPGLFGSRIASFARSEGVPDLPPVSLELLKKGIADHDNSSIIYHYAEGDLVRVIVPVSGYRKGAVVVSSYIPISLVSRMDDIASALANFRDTDPLAYPIKSIYLILLVLMTLVILLGATWFGFYLARQLSVPLEQLVRATQRVVKGHYEKVEILSGAPEINRLISNFNTMTQYLGQSEREIQEANENLRKTLNQLHEHTRYIEIVLSHVTTGVISVDHDGRVTMINRHAARLLELEPEEFIGRQVSEVLSPEYKKLFDDLLGMFRFNRDAETLQKEVQITAGGQPLLLAMTISVLTDEAGREVGKILVFDDLTPMLAAQRAAAWTEVARRIAHEIKNPLTPISLAAQRLQRKFGDQIADPAFESSTKMIVDQVDGLKMLVNEFSQFARMPKAKPVVASLNQTIADALQLFQGEKHFRLHFDPDPRLPAFLFDPDQICRVLTNLVDNAVASFKTIKDGEIAVQTQFDPLSKIVRLIVSDNGAGIPQHIKNRIFEPYVTTKQHGTGLGLAIVKRTVEDHNGYVRVLNNEPRGTRFVIELPVVLSNTLPETEIVTETAGAIRATGLQRKDETV